MRMTMIADDNLVIVDGMGRKVPNLSELIDPSVHAMQWYETWGEVEFRSIDPDGDGPELPYKPPNEKIRAEEFQQRFVKAFEAFASLSDEANLQRVDEPSPGLPSVQTPGRVDQTTTPAPDLTQPIADMEKVLRGLIAAMSELRTDVKVLGTMIDWIMENGQSLKGELLKDIKK